jgi:hypothetical protein
MCEIATSGTSESRSTEKGSRAANSMAVRWSILAATWSLAPGVLWSAADRSSPGRLGKRLLGALVDELIDARDHFRLHQNLDAAIPEYQAEFNQSPAFWTSTLSAHMDATLLRLCKAYDLYESKPSLNLRNFLETIEANLHFFDEPSFRERLKNNAFVDSLAAKTHKPDRARLRKNLDSVSPGDLR